LKVITRFRILIPLIAFAISSVCAEAKITLRTEFQDVVPKFMVSNGVESGISYEIMKMIEAKGNYSFTYKPNIVSLTRISANLSSGAMDIQFGLQKTQEREAAMVYGPSLYAVKLIGVMRMEDQNEIRSIDELIEKRETVLTRSGTTACETLRSVNGLIVDDGARTSEANLIKLLHNRGKILIFHNLNLNYVTAKPEYAGKVKKIELEINGYKQLGLVDQYVVYSKNVPQTVIDDINAIIEGARRSGELAAIVSKYLQ
jgi:ABC-type amino acid transport substrate-binding protein